MPTSGVPVGGVDRRASRGARAPPPSRRRRGTARSRCPGVRPSAAMAAASPSTGVGNFSLVVEPVADGRLEAVVELEHVEGPVRRPGEVGAQVRLGDTRGSSGTRSTSPPGTAPSCERRPAAPSAPAQASSSEDGSPSPSASDDLVQLAALARLRARRPRGTPRSRARCASEPSRAGRTRKVPSCSHPAEEPGDEQRAGVVAEGRHQLAAQLAVLGVRPVGVVHADGQRPHARRCGSGPGRSRRWRRRSATTTGSRAGARAAAPRRGSRRATTATASTATGSSPGSPPTTSAAPPPSDHSTSTASGSAARTSTRASTRRIPGR